MGNRHHRPVEDPVPAKEQQPQASEGCSRTIFEIAEASGKVPLVATVLRETGVPVSLRKLNSDGIIPQDGCLSLDEQDTLSFVPTINPGQRMRTTASRVRAIEIVKGFNNDQETACRIQLFRSAPGYSFSFVCKAGTGDASISQLTSLVAVVIGRTFNVPLTGRSAFETGMTQPVIGKVNSVGERDSVSERGSIGELGFVKLLEPLGLADEYLAAFRDSVIRYEDLIVVTREDLAELVGITDRSHQIKIMAQIKRAFPAYPQSYAWGRNAPRIVDDSGDKAFEKGLKAADTVVNLVGALVG